MSSITTSPSAGKPPTSVLILDDDTDLSEVLRLRLERDGFAVETARSVPELESICGQGCPSAVVMDLNLGQQDGLQAAEFLATAAYGGPVFLISGSDDRVLTAARRHAEAQGLLLPAVFRKPFPLADLSAAIAAAVGAVRPAAADDLLAALERGEIRPYFQPQIDLATGTVVGAEALARWVKLDGSVAAPRNFMPVVEAENLWRPLTDHMLAGTAEAIRHWQDLGAAPCKVSINLEAGIAVDPGFGPHAAALLDAAGIDRSLIRFEITEQTAMGDHATALRALTWMRIRGFDLAIDDFGTGFSSLAVLHAMPFSELKIDQSFVRRMTTDRDARIIVRAIVDLARNLDLVSVAEGVEDQATAAALRDLGCDRGQGFLFGGPVDVAGFARHLLKGKVDLPWTDRGAV
ncbi:EAL domain-containing response regulator [Zavarzinia compransoris]|nr:EAL domain-containing response regulator [Zavarzinia compransoris]TDP47059.1 response regulator receiver modulated diguanylate phosphodiesterase [Zavarzinia compransoris]